MHDFLLLAVLLGVLRNPHFQHHQHPWPWVVLRHLRTNFSSFRTRVLLRRVTLRSLSLSKSLAGLPLFSGDHFCMVSVTWGHNDVVGDRKSVEIHVQVSWRLPSLRSVSTHRPAPQARASVDFCGSPGRFLKPRFLRFITKASLPKILANSVCGVWGVFPLRSNSRFHVGALVSSPPHAPITPNVSSTVFGKCPLLFCCYQDVERRPSLKSQLPPLPFGKEEVSEIHASYTDGDFLFGNCS